MIVWEAGVPWLDRALEAAVRQECFEIVNDIATRYRAARAKEVTGDYAVYPDPTKPNVVRVQSGGYAAAITQDGIVIGFVCPDRNAPPEVRPVGPGTPKKTRKAPREPGTRVHVGRGPNSIAELVNWLREEGFAVRVTNGSHYEVRSATGRRLSTFPSTASDRRAVLNATAQMRRAGADLRR